MFARAFPVRVETIWNFLIKTLRAHFRCPNNDWHVVNDRVRFRAEEIQLKTELNEI